MYPLPSRRPFLVTFREDRFPGTDTRTEIFSLEEEITRRAGSGESGIGLISKEHCVYSVRSREDGSGCGSFDLDCFLHRLCAGGEKSEREEQIYIDTICCPIIGCT